MRLDRQGLKASRAVVALTLLLATGTVQAGPTGEPDEALKQAMIAAINQKDGFVDRFDAEVWLVDMANRLKPFVNDEKQRVALLRMIHSEASRAKLSAELVLSVMEVESRFNRFAISKSGALGYMQIMPFWLTEIGKKSDSLFDSRTNLRYGCTILKYYLEIERGDVVRALARYNGSLGSTDYPALVLTAYNQHWIRS
jgi:soluble lytic murein transglycosylase-like protein